MKTEVLLIAGDLWHPLEVIGRGLRAFGDKLSPFDIDLMEDAKDILTPAALRRYDVIINAKGNYLTAANNCPWFEEGVTEVMPRDFEAWVREGHGFLSLHAGNMAPDNSGYAQFAGNYFVNHPARCEVTFRPVADHPVTWGVAPFTERDEHYHLDGFAEDIHVILKSTSATGGEQIAGYIREMGKGRLVMLAPGHHMDVWENEQFQALFVNALNWAAGK